jgi:hypothetical protein
MPNINYAVLTPEQKTRKQRIRNYKREQAKLEGEYYTYACICKDVYDEQKRIEQERDVDKEMEVTYNNLTYSLKDIFQEHDKQDELKYHSKILAESVVEFLYI